MKNDFRRVLIPTLLLGTLSACSGGGGSSGAGPVQTAFALSQISAPPNAVWQINREIEFHFTLPIDFATVSSNTINIVSDTGVPATGSFEFKQIDTDGDGIAETTDDTTIVFQPNCPTKADLSDAGLSPGGTIYTIKVVGLNEGTGNTIRSTQGHALAQTQKRNFSTPNSNAPSTIFLDEVPGPPIPVVRAKGDTTRLDGVSYIEIGGDPSPDSRIYFEFDQATQTYSYRPGATAPSEVPLNLYANEETKTAVYVEFNQPVSPSSTNISEKRIRLEFLDSSGTWVPIDTQVELLTNCTDTGATVRLEPIGLLPAASQFRVDVRQGFQDIVGESNLIAATDFAVVPTQSINFSTLAEPTVGADEFFEDFDFGGTSPGSFQDTDALFDTPPAVWKDGELTSGFNFDGTGGPGGDFDWVVKAGQIFVFDTVSTSIVGGPGGIATTTELAKGGVVHVRDLIVEAGGVLRVQGTNTMLINATGTVRIDGKIDVSGFTAKDVATLNTGAQPETGAAGAAAGGRGGDASEVRNNSTPRGGTGFGPYLESGTGGQGGESGYAPDKKGKDARRPGGGGGGRFAADFNLSVGGLFAQQGFPGHPDSTGAETGMKPAMGGLPGPGPFQDNDPGNDFFGIKPIVQPDGMGGYQITGLVRGELTSIWAGYGGGGGGDALPSKTFPTPKWNQGSDEKGGGGGGAGGGLRIRALGPIVFGPNGVILAEGGHGGTGENTSFLDHVGGTGGSGSGGHVILESATLVDFTDGDPLAANKLHVSTKGAKFYKGSNNPRGSSIPKDISYGGGGGPGVIQIHVPSINPPSDDPATSNIIIPTAQVGEPDPLLPFTKPSAIQMIPTFGARSKVRSKWISIGGADLDPGGGTDLVEFLFEGTDTSPGDDSGKILTSGGGPMELAPLMGPSPLPSSTATLLSDGNSILFSGSSLDPFTMSTSPVSKDIYLRSPVLLRHFLLRVSEVGNPANLRQFDVSDASYDEATQTLTVHVAPLSISMADYVAGLSAAEFVLVPRFFRTVTGGVIDSLPTNSFVRISFEGTGDDGFGNPDEANLLVPLTGDISEFNALAPGALRFFRFQVEFDLDEAGLGVPPNPNLIQLQYLRIPFRF
ncbi:MAG TPA: hypothetical protein ENJ09_13130 [Planctomycetes bacterium]|nr:hypothetical protein [Planctomycetota bacterium]